MAKLQISAAAALQLVQANDRVKEIEQRTVRPRAEAMTVPA